MSIASTDPGVVAGRGSDNDALDAGAWDAVLRDTTPSPLWLREQERAHVCAPLGQQTREAKELVETAALIPEYAPEDVAAAAEARYMKLQEAITLGSAKLGPADRATLQKYIRAARAGRPLNQI
jgi:hypothetical protein